LPERFGDLTHHGRALDEISSVLDSTELCGILMSDPTISPRSKLHILNKKAQYDILYNEIMLLKYWRLFYFMEDIYDPSNRLEGLSIPKDHRIQYKAAIGWFQEFESNFRENFTGFISNINYPSREFLINTFIEKWKTFQPDIDTLLLYKELVLSYFGKNELGSSAPMAIDQDEEERFASVQPLITYTMNEYIREKDIFERSIQHFPTLTNIF
jgi:hypothetical protein